MEKLPPHRIEPQRQKVLQTIETLLHTQRLLLVPAPQSAQPLHGNLPAHAAPRPPHRDFQPRVPHPLPTIKNPVEPGHQRTSQVLSFFKTPGSYAKSSPRTITKDGQTKIQPKNSLLLITHGRIRRWRFSVDLAPMLIRLSLTLIPT